MLFEGRTEQVREGRFVDAILERFGATSPTAAVNAYAAAVALFVDFASSSCDDDDARSCVSTWTAPARSSFLPFDLAIACTSPIARTESTMRPQARLMRPMRAR